MPIELQLDLQNGWKEKENKRFGQALVINFIDTDTRKVIFSYAPKLDEQNFWTHVFVMLEEYDKVLMKIKGHKTCGV